MNNMPPRYAFFAVSLTFQTRYAHASTPRHAWYASSSRHAPSSRYASPSRYASSPWHASSSRHGTQTWYARHASSPRVESWGRSSCMCCLVVSSRSQRFGNPLLRRRATAACSSASSTSTTRVSSMRERSPASFTRATLEETSSPRYALRCPLTL